jgi:hypothetical protein
MQFARDEVEAAFRHYFMTGPVLEDWVAWAHLFTDDAVYTDHFWGTFHGPAQIQAWIEGTISSAPQVYTVLDFHVIDDARVVYKAINRADNPQVGGAPFDFASFQFVTYAGDGKWSAEEDVWVMAESKAWGAAYLEAVKLHDPTHPAKMTRLDWGHIDWARPAPGHQPTPSWMGRDDLRVVRNRRDMQAIRQELPR